ncbi:FAD-binding and (Fe-S)-binding domain-containing protein [Phytoactinopolyspora mesophila]|uniref:D-lactate dehydrogenase (cytochrome) n=1 Tax=Phytoactinopolyspora mesophila TaxID=2650750 RepID=A0A7K3MAK4_9ACTN|nr:FAD-binding and (Fe-S)-binding domain-containing protein [Phytoactinopolyspora mesophila]NDL60002.1 FAD-binding protein [Phytoactinopolyspora mesophila]
MTGALAREDAVLADLRHIAGAEAVRTSVSDLAAMAHDASHYLLHPRAVLVARGASDVAEAMHTARRHQLPVTFRSAGTSLSGQASSAGLLVDTRRQFSDIEILDGGARVRVQPGLTLRQVNARLAPYGRRLGPDPASESACTIGGVVANNSSGMSCGTVDTAYRTVESMVLVLASGTILDTGAADATERLRALEPELHAGLLRLRDHVRGSTAMRAVIEHQFSMKNTMGYGVNALLDFDDPVDILAHLLVGSEGTLGFVAEVTLRTVPLLAHAATTLLVFDSLPGATDALEPLIASGARAIELLDAASLRVAQSDPAVPESIAGVDVVAHTALLVEYQAENAAELSDLVAAAGGTLDALSLAAPATLTKDAAVRNQLWRVRKGLYAAVAGARPVGSTALLEDVVVPVPVLTATVSELIGLFGQYGYDDAVIFGHAKDGNLHFMINPKLDEPAELARYEAFTEGLVDLVLGRDGSLKAEHGTGRIMAPFVRRQFGDQLYDVMREIKRLFDPDGLLNPGVLIDDDPQAHVKNLKVVPAVHSAVDSCVECGYCEPVCPSRNTTTTPRQRIVLMREIAAATGERRQRLEEEYDYAAVDTCAADSLCVTACPVNIDTGKVMKEMRADRHGALGQRAGVTAARHWGGAVRGLRAGLRVAEVVPDRLIAGASSAGRRVLGPAAVPQLGSGLPGPGPARPRSQAPPDAAVVFFPACVASTFGPAGGELAGPGATEAFLRLCGRAGVPVAIPDGIGGLCCGTPWASKGLTSGNEEMARRVFAAVWTASRGGDLPVVCDASSCAHGLEQLGSALVGADRERYDRLRVLDAVTYVGDAVLPHLTVWRRLRSLAIHPTCSNVHMGTVDDVRAVAEAAAERVVVPAAWGCCGFAGDRGMFYPELTSGATEAEAAELAQHDVHAYASSNRTCEMGMSAATGEEYHHVLELLEAATREPG